MHKFKKVLIPNLLKGFTLIELMMVVAIIAILATLILAMLGDSKEKTSDAKIISQVGQMTGQGFLYSGATPSINVLAGPVNTGIAGPAPDGTLNLQLFNATTNSRNSLYALGNTLPGGTYIYYGWDGVNPNITGRWFFAAKTSTGAFCNDHLGTKKVYTGGIIAAAPTIVTNWTNAAVFPNAVSGVFRCN